MKYRKLGGTAVNCSVLSMGCGGTFAHLAQGYDRQRALRAIRKAFDLGINYFDTADVYGRGDSERLIGKAFSDARDKVVIASKAGHCYSEYSALEKYVKPLVKWGTSMLPQKPRRVANCQGARNRASAPSRSSEDEERAQTLPTNYSPAYIRTAVEGSLRRLRTEYLDVFQLHSPPIRLQHNAELFELLDRLVGEGKIRHIGVSCFRAREALTWLDQAHVSVIQLPINARTIDEARLVLSRAIQKNIGIVARQPFDHGRIFSALRDDEDLALKLRVVSLPQALLQFSMQQEGVSSVLSGMGQESHLLENVGTLQLEPLSLETMQALRTAWIRAKTGYS